jgi:hypothetical protein
MTKTTENGMDRTLFEARARTDREPSRYGESRFEFLNRAGGPVFSRCRVVMETWFAAYPADGRRDVCARFQARDNRTMLGAFWELYQHEAMRRRGWRITLHPEVPGTTRRPDFLVEAGDETFYLETTVATADNATVARERRRGVIYDLVNDLESPNFWLEVVVIAQPATSPPTKRLRADLRAWLDGLDPDRVHDAGYVVAPERYTWRESGWEVEFAAIPKSPDARGKPGRAIGAHMDDEGGMVDPRTPVRRAIAEKAGRYGQLDRPYVVAVLVETMFTDEDDIFDALFGTVAFTVPVVRPSAGRVRPVRRRDGSYMGGERGDEHARVGRRDRHQPRAVVRCARPAARMAESVGDRAARGHPSLGADDCGHERHVDRSHRDDPEPGTVVRPARRLARTRAAVRGLVRARRAPVSSARWRIA